ncbi:hypothetical protein VTO73DRAFT_10652 [Trametes versicolor]
MRRYTSAAFSQHARRHAMNRVRVGQPQIRRICADIATRPRAAMRRAGDRKASIRGSELEAQHAARLVGPCVPRLVSGSAGLAG